MVSHDNFRINTLNGSAAAAYSRESNREIKNFREQQGLSYGSEKIGEDSGKKDASGEISVQDAFHKNLNTKWLENINSGEIGNGDEKKGQWIETEHYRIQPSEPKEQSMGMEIRFDDKNSIYPKYFRLEDLKIQIDEATGDKFFVSSCDFPTVFKVDEELQKLLEDYTSQLSMELETVPLEEYTLHTDIKTGIQYMEQKSMMIEPFVVGLTPEQEKIVEDLKEEYMSHSDLGLEEWQARKMAYYEITGVSVRTQDGILFRDYYTASSGMTTEVWFRNWNGEFEWKKEIQDKNTWSSIQDLFRNADDKTKNFTSKHIMESLGISNYEN